MAKKKNAELTPEQTKDLADRMGSYMSEISKCEIELRRILKENNITRNMDLNDPHAVEYICTTIANGISGSSYPELRDEMYKTLVRNNSQLAARLLSNYNYRGDYSKYNLSDALDALMDDPDTLIEIFEKGQRLSAERAKILYEKYGEQWFKDYNLAPKKLEILCRVFRNNVSYEQLDLMVTRFVGRKMLNDMIALKTDKEMKLPEELVDKLDSGIMMSKLTK